MEDEPLVKETDKKLLYNNLPKSDSSGITNAVNKGTEQSKMTSLIGDPNKKAGFSLYSNRSNENPPKTGVRFKAAMSGNNETKTPLYSGDIWDNEPQEDLFSNDISHEDLYGFFTPSDNENTAKWQKRILPFFKDFKINANDLLVPEAVHIASLRNLGNLSSCSNKDMNKVANQLIDHFLSGTGNDFSSVEFTKAVGEHKQTQRYMDDFTKTFKEALSEYNGNVSEIVNSKSFNDTLKKTKCYCHNTIIVISKIYLEDIHSLFIHGQKVMFR